MPLPELETPYLVTFGDHRVPILVTRMAGSWIHFELPDDDRVAELGLPTRIKKRHWNGRAPVLITEEIIAAQQALTEETASPLPRRRMSPGARSMMMLMVAMSSLGGMHAAGPPAKRDAVKPSSRHRHPRTFRGRK